MLPELYRKTISPHLSESQIITLERLILLIQSHREITLGKLAALFPQPIKYSSRVRNLQRFFALATLSVRLLWFPIVKYWLRREYCGKHLNHQQRRRQKKLKKKLKGYVVLALDRTQWKGRNILMTTIVWGNHALPIYWPLLGQDRSSSLALQKRLLNTTLKLLKPYPVLVLGDREFHSPKLPLFLKQLGVDFALRQKKSTQIQLSAATDYQPLSHRGFTPGTRQFLRHVWVGKESQLGPFNLACRWKRKYRSRGGQEAWFILTNLSSLTLTLLFYRCLWGIETMFKDFKSGGYHLESSQVNDARFLALFLLLVLAYSLATSLGYFFLALVLTITSLVWLNISVFTLDIAISVLASMAIFGISLCSLDNPLLPVSWPVNPINASFLTGVSPLFPLSALLSSFLVIPKGVALGEWVWQLA